MVVLCTRYMTSIQAKPKSFTAASVQHASLTWEELSEYYEPLEVFLARL